MTILEILDSIEATNSPLMKKALLAGGIKKNKHFTAVLVRALDPYRRFHLRKVPALRVSGGKRRTVAWPEALAWLDVLASRAASGQAAAAKTAEMLNAMERDDATVFRRILHKDLRCGINVKLVNAAMPGLIPTFELQFAAPFEASRASYPLFGDLKLDGMRVVAIVRNRDVEFLSRGGRPVMTLDHIKAAVRSALPKGGVFDGEAVLPGGNFEDSISAIKRGTAKPGQVAQLVVFDHLTLKEWDAQHCLRPYYERRATMSDIITPVPHLFLSNAKLLKSADEVAAAFVKARERGFEGLVLKAPNGRYEFKRSHAWMKYKAAETIDVEIIDAIEGSGKYAGSLGALAFEYGGVTCRAGTGFSDEQRAEFWRAHQRGRRPIVGQTMEVEFTEVTGKGRTRHARFIRLRSYDGERS